MYGSYEGCDRYIESKARTNKLWCSDCSANIEKGENVVFFIDNSTGMDRMKEVYCSKCAENYKENIVADSRHPFDIDDSY